MRFMESQCAALKHSSILFSLPLQLSSFFSSFNYLPALTLFLPVGEVKKTKQ